MWTTAQLDVAKMAESLRQYKGHSSTACPNASDWESAFAGADEVFALTITSALSGSCNAAQCAKAHYESIHPDCRIHVIDTLSTGPRNAAAHRAALFHAASPDAF